MCTSSRAPYRWQLCTHQNRSSSALLSQFKLIIETGAKSKPKAAYSDVDNVLKREPASAKPDALFTLLGLPKVCIAFETDCRAPKRRVKALDTTAALFEPKRTRKARHLTFVPSASHEMGGASKGYLYTPISERFIGQARIFPAFSFC